MTKFRWGIFGTGEISAKFVAGLAVARDAEASFVASRSLTRAQRMAKQLGVARAIEGYAEAAAAGGVDAIYIATPPALHAEQALLCIEAGIPVLVEKPFAATANQARQIAESAATNSIFVMEAMWTRFLPAARALRERVSAGHVGDVRQVAGSFGTSQTPDVSSSSFDPTLGGGAMAQLGVYPLSIAQWLFGSPSLTQATGSVGLTGVDEDVAFQLVYAGGVLGSFFVSLRAWSPNEFQVMGTHGMIRFDGSLVRPTGLSISSRGPLEVGPTDLSWRARLRQHPVVHRVAQLFGATRQGRGKRVRIPYSGNGYHYQADEVRACVERGAVESSIMPLADSIAVASTVDDIRQMMAASTRAGDR